MRIRSHRPAARRRAFSLIEVLIALTIAAVIATSAMAMFLTVRRSAIETATRAQLARDGQLTLDLIAQDLRFFGAGVPLGTNGDLAASPASGKSLLPIVRLARDDNLVFLGDLPYPNAELSGLVSLSYVGNSGSDAHRIAVTSEASGACLAPVSSTAMLACSTSASTLLPGLQSAGDCSGTTMQITATTDAAGFQSVRTCAWGMNKWMLGNGNLIALTVVDPDGRWYERRNKDSKIGGSDVDSTYVATHLDHDFPVASGEDLGRSRFFGLSGGSYVAVLDRVFYAVEDTASAPGTPCTGAIGGDCSLRRRQCWGRLGNPDAASFPVAGTTTFFGSASTPGNCTASASPDDGTGWETVVSGVEDISFKYYSDATTQLAGTGTGLPLTATQASQIKAIEVEVRVSRRIPGMHPARFLSDVLRRRYVLPNQQ